MTFLMLRRLVLLVAALVLALTVTTQTTASAPSTRTDTRQDTVTSDLQLTPFMTLVSDRFARAGSPSTAAAGVVTMRSRSLAAPLTAGR